VGEEHLDLLSIPARLLVSGGGADARAGVFVAVLRCDAVE
jgi:hypothetical protein